jgi:hypothetical protein
LNKTISKRFTPIDDYQFAVLIVTFLRLIDSLSNSFEEQLWNLFNYIKMKLNDDLRETLLVFVQSINHCDLKPLKFIVRIFPILLSQYHGSALIEIIDQCYEDSIFSLYCNLLNIPLDFDFAQFPNFPNFFKFIILGEYDLNSSMFVFLFKMLNPSELSSKLPFDLSQINQLLKQAFYKFPSLQSDFESNIVSYLINQSLSIPLFQYFFLQLSKEILQCVFQKARSSRHFLTFLRIFFSYSKEKTFENLLIALPSEI